MNKVQAQFAGVVERGALRSGADELLAERPPPLADSGPPHAMASPAAADLDLTDLDLTDPDGETLRATQRRLHSIVAQSAVILWAIDSQGTITLSEGKGLAALGLRPGQAVGRNAFEMYAEHDPISHNLRCALAGEELISLLEVGEGAFECTFTPLRDARGAVIGAFGVATDVTRFKRTESALRTFQEELEARVRERTAELMATNAELVAERRAQDYMLRVQDRDRTLVAYELHDGLVQQLTGALMHLEAYREAAAQGSDRASEEFDRSLGLLRMSLDEGRRLISGLRPPILDECGIVAAVEYLIRDDRTHPEIQVEFVHDVRFDRLVPVLEGAVYRIVQESLSNVRRHSRALRARVLLVQTGERLHLEIRDWGRGFDASQVSSDRYGIQGIRERARLLRGSARIESSPGRGTQILVDLPVTQADSPRNERAP